jgi:O-antigen/teichoic acid export membrane protein
MEIFSEINLVLRISLTLFTRSIAAFGPLLLSYVVSNTFGLDILGHLTNAIALMLALVVTANFGSSSLIVKSVGIDLVRNNFTAAQATYFSALRISLIVSLSLSAVMVSVVYYMALQPILIWFLIASPAMALLMLNASLLRANNDSSLAPFCEFGFLSLVLALIVMGISALGVSFSFKYLGPFAILVTYGALVLSYLVLLKRIPQLWHKVLAPQTWVRQHIQKSRNFFFIEFAQYFSQWGLLLVVALYTSSENVGIFMIVLKLSFLVNFILGVTSNTISAQVANLFAADNIKTLFRLRHHARLTMLCAAVPLALLLWAFDTELLLNFKILSAEAEYLLKGLLIIQVLNVATGLSPVFLKMTGYEHILRNIVLGTLLLQLVLAFALTPIWGLVGVAVTFSTGLLLKNILAVFLERKTWLQREPIDE